MVKIGPAFGDYIKLERSQKYAGGHGRKSCSIRGYMLPLVLVLAVVIISVRLFFLQVVKGKDYRVLSDVNRTKTIPIHASRGIVFDRTGVPLVFNVPGFRLISDNQTKLINKDAALNFLSSGKTNLEIDSLRSYPYKDVASHVLGYIGQISEEELALKEFADYEGGDLIGKIGIEREYENLLKGVDGKELVEVDSMGEAVRRLGFTDPIPGQNITLTLDIALQNTAFEAMKDVKKGAAIVSNTAGEILALVSKPSFDPNLFTMGSAETDTIQNPAGHDLQLSQILNSTEQPLLNRAIAGTYPPGSTFKLITAAAGLENRIIDKDFVVEDTGILKLGAFSFGNWYYLQHGKLDGEVNVVKAIQRSNDIFFYKLAELVGVDKISEFAEKFGLGKRTGIDLSGEESGIVPTRKWKKSEIGEDWYLGDTYHYGIGQGYLLTTPLQVNIWTQVIANGGIIYQPHLLKSSKFKVQSSKFLKDETVSLIRQGMVEACGDGGVAWPLFNFKIQNSKLKVDGKNFLEAPQATVSADLNDYRQVVVACKTGTAQHGGEETLPHAWITLFVPAYDPQIVVTVLAESSGEGSNIAAPIAKKILEEWFSR